MKAGRYLGTYIENKHINIYSKTLYCKSGLIPYTSFSYCFRINKNMVGGYKGVSRVLLFIEIWCSMAVNSWK